MKLNFLYSKDKTQIKKNFKFACKMEGVSCILLFIVAMPLKYQWGIWWQMIPIGSFHGLAFTYYLLQIVPAKKLFNWDDEEMVTAIMAAFFPFATFWVEKKMVP